MTENDPKLEREVFEILGGDLRCRNCGKLPQEVHKLSKFPSSNYIYGEVWQEGIICPDCHESVVAKSKHFNEAMLYRDSGRNWSSTNSRWWVCVQSKSNIRLGGNARSIEIYPSIYALYASKSWKELTK